MTLTTETTEASMLPETALVNLANAMPDLILVSLAFESRESGHLHEETVLRILDMYPSGYGQKVLIVREDKALLGRFRLAMIQRLCKVGHFSNGAVRITDVIRVTDKNREKWVYNPSKHSPFKYNDTPTSSATAFAARLLTH